MSLKFLRLPTLEPKSVVAQVAVAKREFRAAVKTAIEVATYLEVMRKVTADTNNLS